MDIQVLDSDRFVKKGGKIEVLSPIDRSKPIELLSDDAIIDALTRSNKLRELAIEYNYIFIRDKYKSDLDYLKYCKSYG